MGENTLSPCLLLAITDANTEKKMERMIFDAQLPLYFQCRGQGTANSELLNICGLSGRTRLITATILPRQMVPAFFEKLRIGMAIEKKGAGIAVTVPMLGMQEMIMKALNEDSRKRLVESMERAEKKMNQDSVYTMILVSVKEGYSDEVIDAATRAGGKGGTIIRGRRRGNETLVQFLGLSLQEEQEMIMLVAPKENKLDIMKAVSAACGLKTSAQGTVLAIPVDNVIGIDHNWKEAHHGTESI